MDKNSNASLETVIISTQNMEKLAAFYQQALELGEFNRSPAHIGVQVGPVYLGFDQVDDNFGRGDVSLWFNVDDIQVTFDRMLALGAEERYPPTEKPWGAILASLFDPDGNLIGLSQRQ